LKLFAGLESDRLAGRNVGDFARARVAAYAALAGLDDEDAKAAKLYALAALKGRLHRVEQRFDRDFGLYFWDSGLIGHLVDYIEFDHVSLRLCFIRETS
jgi:hypothetical protein